MIKKVMSYLVIIILSIIMWMSITMSIIGSSTKETKFSFNDNVEIENIYIDGIREELDKYKNNDTLVLSNIDIYTSKISDIYINVVCNESKIKVDYDGVQDEICSYPEQKNDYIYVGGHLKNNFINYVNSTNKVFLVGLFILLNIVNYFIFNYLKRVIKYIKEDKLKIRSIIIISTMLFIEYLFTFNIMLNFLKSYIVIPIGLLILYLLYLIKDKIKDKIEYAFVIIGLFGGLTMLFLIPPMHVPDETQHFIKVYSSSNFNNYNITTNEYGTSFLVLNTDMQEFINKYSYDTLTFNAKYKPITYVADMFKSNNGDLYFKNQWYSLYTAKFTAYIPAILMCIITQLLNFSPLLIFYCCRFINFMLFLLANYYAIKKIPKFKKLFMLIALLPITLQSAIGINQDSLNNTIFVLLLSIFLRLIYNEEYKLNKKVVITVFILSVLLCCCKTIYIASLLLLFLAPKSKYKEISSNRFVNKYFIWILIGFTVITCFIFYKYVGIRVNATNSIDYGHYEISDLIANPLHFIHILVNTFDARITLDFFRGLFDGFGWSTIWSVDIIRDLSTIIYALLIFGCLDIKQKLTKQHHIINWLIIVILTGCISYAMLFGWSSKDITIIDGLQPRYFIPIVYFLYLEIASLNIVKINEKYDDIIYTFLLIIGLLLANINIINGFI